MAIPNMALWVKYAKKNIHKFTKKTAAFHRNHIKKTCLVQ